MSDDPGEEGQSRESAQVPSGVSVPTESAQSNRKDTMEQSAQEPQPDEQQQPEEVEHSHRTVRVKSTHGAPKYSEKQLEMAKSKLADRKKARARAKEEEKNFVEFRKKEILFQFKPTTAGAFKNVDESFPRRRRGISMGFGERKAYFLAIRPNPRFAVWFGKRKARRRENTDKDDCRVMAPCAPQPVDLKKDGENGKNGNDSDSEEDKRELGGKQGNMAGRHLIKGVPFWTIPNKNEEEVTDEDLPIDTEFIMQVMNGEKKLEKKPFEKTKFDTWDDVQTMKKYDKLFDRETIIITNMCESVIALMTSADEYKEGNLKKTGEQKRKLTWAQTINVTTFNKGNREPRKGRQKAIEPLQDIQKPKGK